MAHIGYGMQLKQRKSEIAAKKAGMPGAPQFYIVVWHRPTVQQDLQSELFLSLEEALTAYNRLVDEVTTHAQAFDSDLITFSSNANSIGMSHVQHQHAGRRILTELDECSLQKRQHNRRLFRGVLRATLQLILAQRRAAERVYAPGATGYEGVRASFEAAKEQEQHTAPLLDQQLVYVTGFNAAGKTTIGQHIASAHEDDGKGEVDEQYKVVCLKAKRVGSGVHVDGIRKGRTECLVQWENGPNDEVYEDSWEPPQNLEKLLATEFEKAHAD